MASDKIIDRSSEVFQEFGHILSHSHPEKELPVLQTKMHLYPCKMSGAFNTKIIIPLSIVYCNRTLGARGIVGNLIHGTSLLHGWPHQRLTACNTASEACVLTFLQHWLCGPSYQREEIKYSKKEQILKEQCFEIVARRTVLYICLLRDSGCGQLSTRKRESIPKLSAQFWDIF